MRFASARSVQLDGFMGDDQQGNTWSEIIPDERAVDPAEESACKSDLARVPELQT